MSTETTVQNAPSVTAKLSPLEFALRAIRKLRDPAKSKGIHVVYSGFNAAFREYFPELDPVATINALEEQGDLVKGFARGGPMLYLPGEMPARRVDNSATIAKIIA